MSVEELEKAVAELQRDELARFRAWFETFDSDKWDEQIEADIKAGKLDRLADEAIAEHKAGRSRRL